MNMTGLIFGSSSGTKNQPKIEAASIPGNCSTRFSQNAKTCGTIFRKIVPRVFAFCAFRVEQFPEIAGRAENKQLHACSSCFEHVRTFIWYLTL
jgi:hypothetical protein